MRIAARLLVTIVAGLLLGGCGAKEAGHEHADGGHAGEAHDHEHEGEAQAAAVDGGEHAHEEEHEGDHEHGHEHEGEADFARIAPGRAESLGVRTSQATGGEVAETVTLTGRLVIDPRRIAAVRARFPGPVVRVHKEVGDAVRQGEPLADVESNESLTVYTVRSPLAGVVLERRTNVGDVAGTDPLFRVGDVAALQAELKAFPSQRASLAPGAAARIQVGEQEATGRVVAIAPQVEGHTQAIDVRVALQSLPEGHLVPGQFVTGVVERSRGPAGVVVPPEAVQRLEGREVVFVPEAEGFRARPVKVGRRASGAVEILEGLQPGTPYVAAGAFLLKAEIGKNEAAHEH